MLGLPRGEVFAWGTLGLLFFIFYFYVPVIHRYRRE